LFKTLKYRPSYPESAFGGIEQAREWVSHFVRWYNTEHLHSAIRFVTPTSRHQGLDKAILAKRHAVYENAKRLNPRRWSGQTRNWSPITEVHLNPKKQTLKTQTEMPIHHNRDRTAWTLRTKDSEISAVMKSKTDSSRLSPKNGSHNCPITNASESGRGVVRDKNPLNEDRSQSSPRNLLSRFNQTLDHPALES
jgi:hypothetical protein